MAYLLKPDMLSKMEIVTDVKKLMLKDIKNAVGKTEVKFVAAKNWKIGTTHMNLFIVTDTPALFETLIKKSGAQLATGTASITLDKGKTKVVVKKASGAISHEAVAAMVGVTVGDPAIVASTPEKEHDKAEQEQEESDKAKRPKPDALKMAKASHEAVGDFGWKPDQAALKAFAAASIQLTEFHKFKGNFDSFMSKYGLSNDGKLPTDIWNKMFLALVSTDYNFGNQDIERAPDGRFKLLVDGPSGQKIREKTLVKALAGLKPFVDHAATYLDKVVAKGNSGTTWAFWSGAGAEDSAKASGGVALEGTVGSFFAKYQGEWINWRALLGAPGQDFSLWTALSEMYAAKGAEYMAKYKFIGFVGPGATNENNVFNSIEQPTFIEVLTVKQKVAPPQIEWFVVDCDFAANNNGTAEFKGVKGFWNWTKKPNEKFDDRQAALSRIRARYER